MAAWYPLGFSVLSWAIGIAILVSFCAQCLNSEAAPDRPKKRHSPKSSKRSVTLPIPVSSAALSSLRTSISAPTLSLQPIAEIPGMELNVSSVSPAADRLHRRGPSKTFKVYTLCKNASETDLIRLQAAAASSTGSPATSPRARCPSPPEAAEVALTPAQKASLESLQQRISNGEICSQVKRILERPVTSLPVYTDLPRLAHRVVLHDHDHDMTIRSPVTSDKDDALRWRASVSWLSTSVALRVESSDRATEIASYCSSLKGPDSAIWTESLFASCIGNESRTASVLKAINQSVIMPVATELKLVLFSTTGQITKDSRAPSGWEILLDFHQQSQLLYVTHIRTELSTTDDFELQWRLKIGLDLSKKTIQVDSVSLKACELTVHRDIDDDLRGRLMAAVRSLTGNQDR